MYAYAIEEELCLGMWSKGHCALQNGPEEELF